jgi:hypothetical protein
MDAHERRDSSRYPAAHLTGLEAEPYVETYKGFDQYGVFTGHWTERAE